MATRACQPRHHQHLPPGHRQQRDHQHRPRTTVTDHIGHRRAHDQPVGPGVIGSAWCSPGRPAPCPAWRISGLRARKARDLHSFGRRYFGSGGRRGKLLCLPSEQQSIIFAAVPVLLDQGDSAHLHDQPGVRTHARVRAWGSWPLRNRPLRRRSGSLGDGPDAGPRSRRQSLGGRATRRLVRGFR